MSPSVRVFSALVLALVASACGPSNTFHGDLAFTPAERATIEAAADVMAERTGGERIAIVWDGDVHAGEQRILRRVPPNPDADGELIFSSRQLARSIYVRPGIEPTEFRRTIEHELGHWYGLDHIHESGLMRSPGALEWSENDVVECRRAGLCTTY